MAKLQIVYTSYQEAAKAADKQRCAACSGSGWYDSTDRKGRPVPCGGCDGTGKDQP
jgi:DnaJ-class molecular chaperone